MPLTIQNPLLREAPTALATLCLLSKISIQRYFIITLLAIIFPTASWGSGKCYRLIEQERYFEDVVTPDNKIPVCKVVLDNLNKQCNDETPMVCRFKIHPKYSRQLSVPKWESLDIHKNMGMIEAMVRAPWEIYELRAHDKKYQDKEWQEYYSSLRKGHNEGTATLHKAHFDLRNIGKSYDVLRVVHGKCTGKAIPADDPKKIATIAYERSRVNVEYTATALKKYPLLRHIQVFIGYMTSFSFEGKLIHTDGTIIDCPLTSPCKRKMVSSREKMFVS